MTDAALGRQPLLRRRTYIVIGLLMVAIAIAGFWPKYFGHILPGTLNQPPVIHMHASVFMGWLALVIAQAWVAASGHIALHKRLGDYIFIYGASLIPVGWLTAGVFFVQRVDAGEIDLAKDELWAPLRDMLFFAPALLAAWLYRRKGEWHKRLIIVATTVLLIPAAHRLVGAHIGRPPPLGPVLAIWLSPILAGMAYDAATRRLVHPVYVIGVAWILVMKLLSPLLRGDAWDTLASWLATLVP